MGNNKKKKKKNTSNQVLMILVALALVLLVVLIIVLLSGGGKRKVDVAVEGESTVANAVDESESSENTREPSNTEAEELETEDLGAEESSEEESNVEESDVEESDVEESDVEETNVEETNVEESYAEESNVEELPTQTFGSWDLSTLSGESVPYGFDRNKTDAKGAPEGLAFYESKWGQYNVDFISDRTDENVIYLTMDEGFANEQTEQVLDILKEKNVKVTFFCTSDFVNNCPYFIERMINEGHRIGSHSITHRKMPTLDLTTQKEEIMDVVNTLKSKYDYDVRLFRFPEGEFSDQSLALVENCGLKTVFWSFAYRDFAAEQPDVQESLKLTLDSVHPGAIYLLHANSSTNLALLPDFIDGVRAIGYEFAGVYPVD